MMLNGLSAGFSREDMRHMKYTHLMHILYEWEDMHGEGADEERNATEADARWLMGL